MEEDWSQVEYDDEPDDDGSDSDGNDTGEGNYY
jgi:hypothetical protein